jgi:hypothetical protein
MRKIRYSCFALLLAAAFGSFSAAFAQNTRSTPKPLATPPRVVTGAEIISRADELYNSPLIVPAENGDIKPASESPEMRELLDRIKKLESTRAKDAAAKKADPDDVQKRMLLNLDILTRAEQRSESLRKQLFEMIEKENTVRGRLEQINFDIRPEMIERSLQLAGSMKPEEVRENRRKSLAAERDNLQALLTEIQTTRNSVNVNLQRSEILVEKLRLKLEKDIDDALLTPDK